MGRCVEAGVRLHCTRAASTILELRDSANVSLPALGGGEGGEGGRAVQGWRMEAGAQLHCAVKHGKTEARGLFDRCKIGYAYSNGGIDERGYSCRAGQTGLGILVSNN